MSAQQPSEAEATVLVYSDDRTVREEIRLAMGTRVAADLPPVRVVECATPRAVIQAMDAGGIDVALLDGEAVPAGGMGICRQVKDEIVNCPPVMIVVARLDDAWLATWSRADAVVAHPIDPVTLPDEVAGLLRQRRDSTPARA
ncbi:MAG: hypothetical protein Q4F67_15535 [Propionibacteriaceae bacterium]|nr:hypothetical protein [Propionibacteriaceae bacterium]